MNDIAQKVLSLDVVLRRLQRGPLDRATVATIIAEQLSDIEFDSLTEKQRTAVALRRLGLTSLQCADALDLSSGNLIDQLFRAAKNRLPNLEGERRA
ncbi:hypothetical protein [Methylocystis iwaonis]|uniref:hypothetical protein n=1 Tax=Methylocystis iwaonis TaxID=2885079 RepID=UPI002E7B2B58|nr:hypothetical protein [Methylocystis iwaonis]